jgi:hypothetical protein
MNGIVPPVYVPLVVGAYRLPARGILPHASRGEASFQYGSKDFNARRLTSA